MGGNALVHFLGTADAALRHSRTRALAWLLVVLVVLSAAIGLGAAVSNRPELLGEPSDPGGYGVGDAAPAPFGTVRVTDVGTLDGVTHGALAGATRGVKSYVDGAHATVQATLRVDNTSAHRSTLRVDQFRLRVTARREVDSSGARMVATCPTRTPRAQRPGRVISTSRSPARAPDWRW